MLILPLKPALRYDIMTALANWLDSDHHISFDDLKNPLQFILPKPEFCSVECRDELLRLQSLRNSISDTITRSDSHAAALNNSSVWEDMHEYHAVLLEFEKRGFPTVDDAMTGIQLTWKAAWSEQQKETHAHVPWERSAILFNIAALYSYKAATECKPTNREECKQAVSYYQTAATIISILKQLVAPEDFSSIDFSNPLLTFWESFFLAAAQTNVYRILSMTGDEDAAKHKNLSALAQSAHHLYNTALKETQDPRLTSELAHICNTEWAPFCKAQAMIHGAKAEYHQGVVHRMSGAWGKEIARLRACHDKLLACQEFCDTVEHEGAVEYVLRESKVIRPVVYDRLVEVEKDNYKIYQDTVPKVLEEIPRKQLAKVKEQLPETMLLTKKTLFTNL